MYKDGAAWADLTVDYKNSLNMIKVIRSRRKNSDNLVDIVDYEIAGNMESELTHAVRELKKKTLYEYNTITEEDILNPLYGLTERQKEIALLRQKYPLKKISQMLGIEQCTVYIIYEQAVDKVLRGKSKMKEGLVIGLSEQQNMILKLMNKGYKNKEIALELGISTNSVKVQKNRIQKRLTKL